MVAIALSKCVMVITHMEFTHLARDAHGLTPTDSYLTICVTIGEEWNVNSPVLLTQNMHEQRTDTVV